ncbi:MAG: hypothetical protein ACK2UO_03685 [Caldilineaceae bacterium]
MRSNRAIRVAALILLTCAGLVLGFAQRATAAQVDVSLRDDGVVLTGANANQTFFDDLEVEEGEVVDDDVVVYDGDVRVKDRGRISGNLVVYSGDIRIDSGGAVDGNVSSFSGDIRVAGSVGGNVTTLSGDADLRDGSSVGGDVSVLNGDVSRASGASVGGNVVRGPRLEIPSIPSPPLNFGGSGALGANTVADAGPNVLQRFASFILRFIAMLLLSLLVGAGVWLIGQVRPSFVRSRYTIMSEQPALSFVAGILANVVLLIAGAVFALTICLILLTVATYGTLFVLNILGWAVLSYAIGQRLTERYGLTMRWDVTMALVAAGLAAVLGLLWAMGGCFRFFGFAGMLVLASIGAGAVLLPFLNRLMHPVAPRLSETPSAPVESAVVPQDMPGATADTSGQAPAAALSAEDASVITDVDAGAATEASDIQPQPDDFLLLRGIGPVSAERLSEAGLVSFSTLAQMTPEQLGEILGWSPNRVRQWEIIEQAERLAKGGS